MKTLVAIIAGIAIGLYTGQAILWILSGSWGIYAH
jgi:hypothetical protein